VTGTESCISVPSPVHVLQLVDVTTTRLQAQDEVLKMLQEQKKMFDSQAAKATGLTPVHVQK